MDGENDSVEVIVRPGAKLTVGKREYKLYCERADKESADLISDDLKSQGFKAIVRKRKRPVGYIVWWAK